MPLLLHDGEASAFYGHYARCSFPKEPGSCVCPPGQGLEVDRSETPQKLVRVWAAGRLPPTPRPVSGLQQLTLRAW